jgi:mannose-6-phosphate isomerase
MELAIDESTDKDNVFELVTRYLNDVNLGVKEIDADRPWGGFFVIDSDSTDLFISTYFPEFDKNDIYRYGSELSPKILVVGPGEELSWQYHDRRAELWKAVVGPVAFKESRDDTLPDENKILEAGEWVQHDESVRHRLIGLNNWGIVAEIWQHTDPYNLSDEADIVRLQDRYQR